MFMMIFTWFEWDSKLGLSDLISGAAAFLTFAAVWYSAKASNSAKLSAEISRESTEIAKESTLYTKKQTELMERDLINTHLPKLIPIPKEVSIPFSKINTSLNSDRIGITPTFDIDLTNVFQGNAYMVSAWLQIDYEQLYKSYDMLDSPKAYNENHGEKYRFRVFINEPIENSIFNTLRIEDNHTTEVYESSIRRVGYPVSSILKQNEKHQVYIPDYVAKVVLDSLYTSIDLISSRKDCIGANELVYLFIRYKTGNQLETSNDYTLRTYKLSIENILIKEPVKDDYGNTTKSEFVFSINFLYKDEV